MKISTICIIMIMICIVTACNNAGYDANNQGSEEKLKVVMDLKYPPFTGKDENGNPEGLEVDIAYALGEYLGKEIEIIDTDFSMLISAIDTKQADIIISEMTIKEERKEKVDFSVPYLFGRTLALVNKDFAVKNHVTDAMSPEEFFAIKDEKITGLSGTVSVSVPRSYGANVLEVTDISSAIMEINQGTADVLVGDNTILGDHAAYPNTTVIYSGIKEYSELAMAVKKGNQELIDSVNAFIETMYEKNGFYIKAGDKYNHQIGTYLQDKTKGLDYLIYPPEKE